MYILYSDQNNKIKQDKMWFKWDLKVNHLCLSDSFALISMLKHLDILLQQIYSLDLSHILLVTQYFDPNKNVTLWDVPNSDLLLCFQLRSSWHHIRRVSSKCNESQVQGGFEHTKVPQIHRNQISNMWKDYSVKEKALYFTTFAWWLTEFFTCINTSAYIRLIWTQQLNEFYKK